MAYVKISDPNIIDLPTIHQIVNVVNQHSDNISALTNNFGAVYNTNPTANGTTMYQFDLASQKIVYGTTRVTADTSVHDGHGGFLVTVGITTQYFTTSPFVVANLTYTGGAGYDMAVHIYDSTPGQVRFLLRKIGQNTAAWFTSNLSYNISWIAIGTK